MALTTGTVISTVTLTEAGCTFRATSFKVMPDPAAFAIAARMPARRGKSKSSTSPEAKKMLWITDVGPGGGKDHNAAYSVAATGNWLIAQRTTPDVPTSICESSVRTPSWLHWLVVTSQK